MTIRENLLVLIKAVEDEPEPLFDLSAFEQITSCGTLHCTLGLAGTLPHFYEQGLTLEPKDGIKASCPHIGGADIWKPGSWEKLDVLFGEDSYYRLFETYGGGALDSELVDLQNDASNSKELALARLNKQLELYP